MVDFSEEFAKAAANGNRAWVTHYHDRGADIHFCDDLALRSACDRGHTKVVRLLLGWGADVDASDGISLVWAAKRGATKIVRMLLDHKADSRAMDDWSLCEASCAGHWSVVDLLLADIFSPCRWEGKSDRVIAQDTESLIQKITNSHLNKIFCTRYHRIIPPDCHKTIKLIRQRRDALIASRPDSFHTIALALDHAQKKNNEQKKPISKVFMMKPNSFRKSRTR